MLPTDLLPPPDRIVVVPSDLADALESAPEALHYFESLPYRRQHSPTPADMQAPAPASR